MTIPCLEPVLLRVHQYLAATLIFSSSPIFHATTRWKVQSACIPLKTLPTGLLYRSFAACKGAAYTFPNDNDANVIHLKNSLVSCCIDMSYNAPSRQPGQTQNQRHKTTRAWERRASSRNRHTPLFAAIRFLMLRLWFFNISLTNARWTIGTRKKARGIKADNLYLDRILAKCHYLNNHPMSNCAIISYGQNLQPMGERHHCEGTPFSLAHKRRGFASARQGNIVLRRVYVRDIQESWLSGIPSRRISCPKELYRINPRCE